MSVHGLTLQERLRLAGAVTHRGKIDNHRWPECLALWESWFRCGPDGARGWEHFLADNSLTEEKLIRLAGLAHPKNKLPAWTKTLQCICDHLASFTVKPSAKFNLSENLARAVAEFAIGQVSSSQNWRLLSARAQSSFEVSLIRRLARTGRQAVSWELSAAGADRQLLRTLQRDGVSVSQYFLTSGVSAEALRLLRNYPALARLWTLQTESWIGFVEDFLEHARSFCGRARTGKTPIISSIDVDLSDPHDGNRAVIRVRFVDKGEWFYKPRSGRQEQAWFDLLHWLNGKGFPLDFQILEIRCGDRHCWMESVRPRAFRNKREVANCCFRFGALISLLQALRGVDFHPGNVIFCGDQPVVVDCETLLHPATRLPEDARAEEKSIFRTGVLASVDQISRMRRAFGRSDPVFQNLSNGFRIMHEFLRTDRSATAYLKKWAGSFRETSGRRIYRPTAHYYQMLEQSLAASLLASGLERSVFLHAFCRNTMPASRVSMEVEALENADIPLFKGKPGTLRLDLSEKTRDASISILHRAWNHHSTQVQR